MDFGASASGFRVLGFGGLRRVLGVLGLGSGFWGFRIQFRVWGVGFWEFTRNPGILRVYRRLQDVSLKGPPITRRR